MNIQYWYGFRFNFVVAHYYGGDRLRRVAGPARRAQDAGDPARLPRPRRPRAASLDRPLPRRPPTISRRGLFALVGAGSLALLLANAGETIGGPLRRLSLLAPRRQVIGPGPNDFQVNKTARGAGITRGDDRAGVPARPALRRARAVAHARGAAGDGPAHGPAADRLRRGLDDDAGVDRRAARRPRARGGRRGAGQRARALAAAARRAAAGVRSTAAQLRRPGRAAGAEGQRRRPLAGPRLSRRGSSCRGCRACTTPSGSGRSSSHEGSLRRIPAAPARAPRRCCRSWPGRCCSSPTAPDAPRILLWLALSAVVHDLVLLPFYSALDRAGQRAAAPGGQLRARAGAALRAAAARVLPGDLGQGRARRSTASAGSTYDGYLARWLLITAALFAALGRGLPAARAHEVLSSAAAP